MGPALFIAPLTNARALATFRRMPDPAGLPALLDAIVRCSPAMAAGVSKTLWSTEDLVSAALDGVRP